MNDGLGKKAEKKIKEWLDKPEKGYAFERIPDQLSGFYGSKNICDFYLYVKPSLYYIESKATWGDSFAYESLTENQRSRMIEKSKVDGVFSIVIVLFATYQRAFIFDVNAIQQELDKENVKKSINIKKINKWPLPYIEIPTISSRKELLDYDGDIVNLVNQLAH